LVIGCNSSNTKKPIDQTDKERFWMLIGIGDSIYGIRQSTDNFNEALVYFDSAKTIADRSNDNEILANMNLSMGRVYDAWGKEQGKTFQYYSKAAHYFKLINATSSERFCKYLTIHTALQNKDTALCLKLTDELFVELEKDTVSKFNNIKSMLAYQYTMMGEYVKAKKVLQVIKHPEKIENRNLNYRNHLIIANALLELHDGNGQFVWQDSIKKIIAMSDNLADSVKYTMLLERYSVAQQNWQKAYEYKVAFDVLNKRFSSTQKELELSNKLYAMEIKQDQLLNDNLNQQQSSKKTIIGLLSASIVALSIFVGLLFKRQKQIAAQKQALETSNHFLQQKNNQNELLTKEIHHRVKNNLYLIYSLLNMQQRKLKNPESIQHIQAAKLRVESIAMMHEQLMHDTINIKDYLNKMINTTDDAIAQNKRLIINMEIEDIIIDQDICFPLALILHEWIVNTLKYANTENNSIHLNICIKQINNQLLVSYSDSGDLRFAKTHQSSTGLGTRIINLLVQQMNAQIVTDPVLPYSYNLTIPHGASN
jgi:two-component sensor histidine kinase